MTSFQHVLDYVMSSATEAELDQLFGAAKQRRQNLAQIRAASLNPGDKVETFNLSPAFYNGLKGAIIKFTNRPRKKGRLASLKLDTESTMALRYWGATKVSVPADVTEYVLEGIPDTSLKPTGTDS